MYQPKIADEHIRKLYRLAKALNMPMTHLVNRLLDHGIARLEQGVENVSEPTAHDYARKTQPTKTRARYGTKKRTKGGEGDEHQETT